MANELNSNQPIFPQIWAMLNDPQWAQQMAAKMPPPTPSPGAQAGGGQGLQPNPSAVLPQFPAPAPAAPVAAPAAPVGGMPTPPPPTPNPAMAGNPNAPAPSQAGANPLMNDPRMLMLAQMLMQGNKGAAPPHPQGASVSGGKPLLTPTQGILPGPPQPAGGMTPSLAQILGRG
jgi:hypothetical protein